MCQVRGLGCAQGLPHSPGEDFGGSALSLLLLAPAVRPCLLFLCGPGRAERAPKEGRGIVGKALSGSGEKDL